MTDIAGVTNTLQATDSLTMIDWIDISSVAGVTATNWVVPAATNQNFYRIATTF